MKVISTYYLIIFSRNKIYTFKIIQNTVLITLKRKNIFSECFSISNAVFGILPKSSIVFNFKVCISKNDKYV